MRRRLPIFRPVDAAHGARRIRRSRRSRRNDLACRFGREAPRACIQHGTKRGAARKSISTAAIAGIDQPCFRNGQSFCENDVYKNAQQDKTLDSKLHLLTCSMIAVPLYFAQNVRGVISCVQLKAADANVPDPSGFSPASIHRIERLSGVLGRMLDLSLVGTTVGWRVS